MLLMRSSDRAAMTESAVPVAGCRILSPVCIKNKHTLNIDYSNSYSITPMPMMCRNITHSSEVSAFTMESSFPNW
jgi:hypothetical protein